MKRFTPLMIVIIFSLSLFANSEDTLSIDRHKTRTITLEEIYTVDSINSIGKSPLLKAFKGIGIAQVKEAYKLNRIAVDSLLNADTLDHNFWRVYGYQAAHVFVQANKSPSMAMSIFLPWFLILFLIVIVILSIKTLFVRPWLMDAEKPTNYPNAIPDEQVEENPQADENIADAPLEDDGNEPI
ncbi:MAG: hypothetical protein QM503_12685 [Bacteroidota bacterium]